MIVGLYGRMKAGKDTTFEVMRGVAAGRGLPEPEQRAFARRMKLSVATLFDISVEEVDELKLLEDRRVQIVMPDGSYKTLTMRRILERMGTEVGRQIFGQRFWVNGTLPTEDYSGKIVVCTDMRFPNEYARVKALGGYCVRVLGTTEIETATVTHESQAALDHHDFDFIIDNSERDMVDLRTQVEEMVNRLVLVYG